MRIVGLVIHKNLEINATIRAPLDRSFVNKIKTKKGFEDEKKKADTNNRFT